MTIQPAKPEKADGQVLQEIKDSKGRAVEQAWPLIQLPDRESLYLVQFVREGDDMLASLALKRESGWLYYDYPAKYDPSSTWRVDDQGEVRPDMFSFLFAAESGLVLCWACSGWARKVRMFRFCPYRTMRLRISGWNMEDICPPDPSMEPSYYEKRSKPAFSDGFDLFLSNDKFGFTSKYQ
ncbi:hypothetical protein M3664_17810 [Paenibacillus lautus]|uniref:hypothetical protein n=1 Tax=Paenibacillus TaxID=44249 RepID=UPI00203AA880|nr:MULTISPECIES: hypothetical protein [Paenibacillus]MCM3259660.1 hypothetical protein [Paenibacillus lautus]